MTRYPNIPAILKGLFAFAQGITYSAGNIFIAGGKQVGSLLSPWITQYMQQLTQINAEIARLIQPLLMRAPWLARFLQPFAVVFGPLFKIIEAVLLLAAIPYIIAAAVSAAMFTYSFIVRSIPNLINGLKYFWSGKYKNKEGQEEEIGFKYMTAGCVEEIKNTYNSKEYSGVQKGLNLAGAVVMSALGLLIVTPAMQFIFAFPALLRTQIGTVKAAYNDGRDAAKVVLNFPILKIMRRPWMQRQEHEEREYMNLRRELNTVQNEVVQNRRAINNITGTLDAAYIDLHGKDQFQKLQVDPNVEPPLLKTAPGAITPIRNNRWSTNQSLHSVASTATGLQDTAHREASMRSRLNLVG